MSKKKKTTRKKRMQKTHKVDGGKRIIQHLKKSLGIYLSILSIAIAIPGLLYYFHDKKIGALTGEISEKGLAQIKYIAVSSSVRMKINTPKGVLFKDGNQPLISMNLERGQLSISTIIRDPDGQIIAELVDNEWQVNKNNIFDRNYNEKALEVRDKFGKIVLQVAHFGNTIYLAGVFNCRNGRTVSIHPIQKGEAAIELIPPGKESPYEIKSIFEYPSERYLGSCPGLKKLEKELLYNDFTKYKFKTSMDICGMKEK